MNLTELKQQEQQLMDALKENRDKQREITKAAFIQQHGYNIGDTIEWLSGPTRVRGLITEIEFHGVNPYQYIATLYNSAGKLGKRKIRIWKHQLPTVNAITLQK